MPEDSTTQLSGRPFHIRSVPDDHVHRPKHKPCAKPYGNSPKSAPLPAFCRLSGGIQRLGGSAFSAFKPLLARSLSQKSQPGSNRPQSPQKFAANTHSTPGVLSLGACSPHSSDRVDTSGESAASLHLGLASPTNSFIQLSPRNLSAASLQCEPSGGSCTSIVGRSSSEDWLKTSSRSKYQEKNRKAQARFRERRKTEAAVKADRLAELEAQLAHMMKERDDLAVRTDTLEQCLISQASSDGGRPPLLMLDSEVSVARGNNSPDPTAPLAHRSYPQTWEEYTAWYQRLVQELAPLLEPAQNGSQSAIGGVETFWREVVDVMKACFLRSDGSLRIRAQTEPSVSTPAASTPLVRPNAALYERVTTALQLTKDQVSKASRVRSLFLDSMRALLQQRQALNAIIETAASKVCSTNCIVAQQHSKCLDAFPRLEANLEDERRINGRLTLEFFDGVVTPLQGAILCVGMWPYLPDSLAILTAVTKPGVHPVAPPSPAPHPTADIASQLPAAMDRATLAG